MTNRFIQVPKALVIAQEQNKVPTCDTHAARCSSWCRSRAGRTPHTGSVSPVGSSWPQTPAGLRAQTLAGLSAARHEP